MSDKVPLKDLWSTEKIASYFGVQGSTVLNWIKEEQNEPGTGLKAQKLNNRWKAYEEDVVAFREMKFAQGGMK